MMNEIKLKLLQKRPGGFIIMTNYVLVLSLILDYSSVFLLLMLDYQWIVQDQVLHLLDLIFILVLVLVLGASLFFFCQCLTVNELFLITSVQLIPGYERQYLSL